MIWTVEFIPHFTLREARCHGWEYRNTSRQVYHDCGKVLLVPQTCDCMSRVRERFARPIIEKSWYRCPAHNLAVGGKADSYHPVGHASDFAPENMADLDELAAIADEEFPFRYVAAWGIHGDIRGQRPVIL